ncbi:hypothetical protein OPQ81_004940 [Rhizoctonia solani]|nr:hypothetical protein OPQ81_004940 [Rhizoctonia solani]
MQKVGFWRFGNTYCHPKNPVCLKWIERSIIGQPQRLSPQGPSDRGYMENNQQFQVAEASLNDLQSNDSSHNVSTLPDRFPFEIWCLITMHAATSTHEGSGDSSKYISNKVKMSSLQNLANVSKIHRQLALYYWASTIHLLNPTDPRELTVLGTTNETNLLCRVRRLFVEELILNCHSDINFGGDIQQYNLHDHGGPQAARMSYRRIKAQLPDTLHTLRIYDSHVPDIYFIQQVAEQCPLLRSLTLARCTIFTRQECEFWRRLPRTETDAYFSNQGISAYAAAIAKELKQIRNLEELSIGIYLTEHGAIDAHLSHHSHPGIPSYPGMEIWEKPCETCIIQYHEPTLAAEGEATKILGKQVPTLSSVSWANFCSTKRTGWSKHQIIRDNEGNFERVAGGYRLRET